MTKFDLPASTGPIVPGPDGNLWFLEGSLGKVGRISTAGVLKEFRIPASQWPQCMTVGPDGAIWFSDFLRGSIYRMSLSGDFTEFPVPSGSPMGIASGSDGNLWFVEFGSKPRVGRMTLSGEVTFFPRPSNSIGWACAPGPNGNVCYSVLSRVFGRVTPSGMVTEFPIAGDRGHSVASMTVGPDGNLWMTVDESWLCIPPCTPPPERDAVMRLSTDGTQTRYELADDFRISGGSAITAGPDGSLWFTARRGLVRFVPSELAPPSSVPVLGAFARAALLTLLALAGLVALRR